MKRILFLICLFALSGCGVTSLSRYSSYEQKTALDHYRFFYVMETSQLYSSTGNGEGMGEMKSVNPADIVTGCMVKRGFIRVADLDEQPLEQTIKVTCGESGRHRTSLFTYAIEMTVQFVDASTNQIILTSTAAGRGATEADGIRKATLQCMQRIE